MDWPDTQAAATARRISAIERLWAQALKGVQHPSGCLCGGEAATPIDPRVLEDDILDQLHRRYQDAGQIRLAAVVEGRRAQLLGLSGDEGFTRWLARAAHLPDGEREALLDDLARALDAVRALDPRGFACY